MKKNQIININNNLIKFNDFEKELIRLGGERFDDVYSEKSGYYFKGFKFTINDKLSLYANANLANNFFKFVIELTVNNNMFKSEFISFILEMNRLASNSINFPFSDLIQDREFKGREKTNNLDITKVLFQAPLGGIGAVSSVLGGRSCTQLAKYNQGIVNVSTVKYIISKFKEIIEFGR